MRPEGTPFSKSKAELHRNAFRSNAIYEIIVLLNSMESFVIKRVGSILVFSLVLLLSACGDDDASGIAVDLSDNPEEIEISSSVPEDSSSSSKQVSSLNSKSSSSSAAESERLSNAKLGNSSGAKASSSSSMSPKSKSSSSTKEKDADGKSSSSISASSSSGKKQSSSSKVKLPEGTIGGQFQMYPFAKIHKVFLRKLDNQTLLQADPDSVYSIPSYDDEKEYRFSSIPQDIRYAEIQILGQYIKDWNVLKNGDWYEWHVLVDLSAVDPADIADVNLLSHFGYERTRYLVNSGMDYLQAKKQAETEVLKAFYMDGGLAKSEEVDLFGDTDDNARLMALYVLVLKSEDFFSYQSIGTDLEKDGVWNSEHAKASLADWALGVNLSGQLQTMRTNMEKWKLGTVPAFEKYIKNYWHKVLGVGECSKNGEVVSVKNPESQMYGTKDRIICKNGDWAEASDIEKDTYQWNDGDFGEVKKGDLTDKLYTFDGSKGKWRDATDLEIALGGCTDSRANDMTNNAGKIGAYWYICKSHSWQETQDSVVDLQGFPDTLDGALKAGLYTGTMYKYDEVLDDWIRANSNDTILNLGACTEKRSDEVAKSPKDDNYYICRTSSWLMAFAIEYDTYGLECDQVGKIVNGKVNKDYLYYCAEGFPENRWLDLTNGWHWNIPMELRFNPNTNYGTMTDSRDNRVYRTVKIGTQTWMAENLNYRAPGLAGETFCIVDLIDSCYSSALLYSWTAALDACPEDWHLPTQEDFAALLEKVGASESAIKLKSTSGWKNDGNGTDDYGFSVLPMGANSGFGPPSQGFNAYFWSADEDEKGKGKGLDLQYDNKKVVESSYNKDDMFSVRCVKN